MCNCNSTTTLCSPSTECSCPVKDLSTDCVVYTGNNLSCSGILQGTILTELIEQLDTYICEAISQTVGAITLINVGTGFPIYKGIDSLGKKEIRTIKSIDDLLVFANSIDQKEITLDVDREKLTDFIIDAVPTSETITIGEGTGITVDDTDPLNPIINATQTVLVEGPGITIDDSTPFSRTISSDLTEHIVIPISDVVTNLTTGNSKAYFRVPFNMTITQVRASLLVAQTAGSIITFDVNKNGTSILSTKLTVDNNEKTSLTATTASVISTASVSNDDEITFDIDQVGTPEAKGAVITLIGTRIINPTP